MAAPPVVAKKAFKRALPPGAVRLVLPEPGKAPALANPGSSPGPSSPPPRSPPELPATPPKHHVEAQRDSDVAPPAPGRRLPPKVSPRVSRPTTPVQNVPQISPPVDESELQSFSSPEAETPPEIPPPEALPEPRLFAVTIEVFEGSVPLGQHTVELPVDSTPAEALAILAKQMQLPTAYRLLRGDQPAVDLNGGPLQLPLPTTTTAGQPVGWHSLNWDGAKDNPTSELVGFMIDFLTDYGPHGRLLFQRVGASQDVANLERNLLNGVPVRLRGEDIHVVATLLSKALTAQSTRCVPADQTAAFLFSGQFQDANEIPNLLFRLPTISFGILVKLVRCLAALADPSSSTGLDSMAYANIFVPTIFKLEKSENPIKQHREAQWTLNWLIGEYQSAFSCSVCSNLLTSPTVCARCSCRLCPDCAVMAKGGWPSPRPVCSPCNEVLNSAEGIQEGEDMKRSRMLQNCLRELKDTESSYVFDIRLVINKFLNPIRTRNILSADTIALLFGNINVLYQSNVAFLQELEKRFAKSETPPVGDIIDTTFFLNAYTAYCRTYGRSWEELARVVKESKKFAAFLDEALADPDLRGLGLKDFLSKPMQRITKYPLLFKEIARYTPPDSPDYAPVHTLLETFQQVVGSINATTRESERLAALERYNSQIELPFGFLAGNRSFVQEFECKIGRKEKGELWLFSDCLLVVSAAKKRKELLRLIPLATLAANPVDEENMLIGNNGRMQTKLEIQVDTKALLTALANEPSKTVQETSDVAFRISGGGGEGTLKAGEIISCLAKSPLPKNKQRELLQEIKVIVEMEEGKRVPATFFLFTDCFLVCEESPGELPLSTIYYGEPTKHFLVFSGRLLVCNTVKKVMFGLDCDSPAALQGLVQDLLAILKKSPDPSEVKIKEEAATTLSHMLENPDDADQSEVSPFAVHKRALPPLVKATLAQMSFGSAETIISSKHKIFRGRSSTASPSPVHTLERRGSQGDDRKNMVTKMLDRLPSPASDRSSESPSGTPPPERVEKDGAGGGPFCDRCGLSKTLRCCARCQAMCCHDCSVKAKSRSDATSRPYCLTCLSLVKQEMRELKSKVDDLRPSQESESESSELPELAELHRELQRVRAIASPAWPPDLINAAIAALKRLE